MPVAGVKCGQRDAPPAADETQPHRECRTVSGGGVNGGGVLLHARQTA